jgi:hypothetical protein
MLRGDIFAILQTVNRLYPGTIPSVCLMKMWYLLYIAAISGAGENVLAKVKPGTKPGDGTAFLGLDVKGTDFMNYALALEVLSKKFEAEFENFNSMVAFIRANYSSTPDT